MKACVVRYLSQGCMNVALVVYFIAGPSILGCLDKTKGQEGGTTVVSDPSTVKPPLTTPERTVCDPFSAGTSSRDRGLVGNILYLEDTQPRYQTARDYINNGTPIQSTVYFDRIFVPTRMWDLGFQTQDGQTVLNQKGLPVYEYFGLRLESELQLAEGEAPGWYQMALLSDDGAVLSRKNADGSYSTLVSNDGDHPTRMGCGIQNVYMDGTTRVPILLEYYQGPRYHISLAVLWRPLPTGVAPEAPVSDVECGRQGNTRYFNPNVVPSAPTAVYYDMLTRGWKPLNNDNFYFPEQASNPCGIENPLAVSNFSIDSTTRTSVTVSWTTNIASTTQVELKNVATGVVTQSPLDSTLTNAHSVTVTGLTANTLYAIKGVSTIPNSQIASSPEAAFRTPR